MTRYAVLFLAPAAAVLCSCGAATRDSLPIPGTAAEQATSPEEAHCSAVANQRAADARANGYGFEIGESVYQEAYQECLKWLALRSR